MTTRKHSRRDFIQQCLLSSAGLYGSSALIGNLNLVHAATASTRNFTDYRALVCVYLEGGNDSVNTIVPRASHPQRSVYENQRSGGTSIVIPTSALETRPLAAVGAANQNYGLNPNLPDLYNLYQQQRLAFIANIGTLMQPTTKAQFIAQSVPLPPQLTSHSDQEQHWYTGANNSVASTGWAGRVADLLGNAYQNPNLSMNVSLSKSTVFLTGASVLQYGLDPRGAGQISFPNDFQSGNDGSAKFNALRALPQTNLLAQEYQRTMGRSINLAAEITSAIGPQSPLPADFNGLFQDEPTDYGGNELKAQLRMVARLIRARTALNMKRQIFYVRLGGFDTHSGQLSDHRNGLARLNNALRDFWTLLGRINMQNSVVSFTASEFGRTLNTNGDGTDHAWGGHQMVLGGAVIGQQIIGNMPSLLLNGADSNDWGHTVPTLASDQYFATLARWYGVPEAQISTIFPNLSTFVNAGWLGNLGFLNA